MLGLGAGGLGGTLSGGLSAEGLTCREVHGGGLESWRAAVPMSYILAVATALMRGSILAAAKAKLPLPQMPMAPMRSGSAKGWVVSQSTAAEKLSA